MTLAATLGGPLRFKPLFSKQNPGFFFISYEGLRLPRETPIVLSVPSMDMRNGNLTDYLAGQGVSAIYQPDGVTPIDPANVPVSAISANLLTYLMPVPNLGPASAYANNYQINFPSPISSNQGDVRLDKNVSDKQSMFARFSLQESAGDYGAVRRLHFYLLRRSGKPAAGRLQHAGDRRGADICAQLCVHAESAERVSRGI